MSGRDKVLEARAVSVRLRGALVLDSVTLDVERGALHMICGPNGAGKSTLLLAVLGQVPFRGEIRCHFQASGRIGFVPQRFAADRTLPLSVGDFLALSRQARPACLGSSPATRRRLDLMLDRVGLSGFAGRGLAELSGGELQRVLLANALDPEPELLILDEASAGLDDMAARMLEEVLSSLKGRVSMLMVSHDLGQVRRIGDHVTLLERGVKREGSPAEVLGGEVFV
ncbi:MAG: metal ABC transporter ATP-binding protein [Acidobacteriota bacterium]